jgi:hypothetical protein
MVAQTPRNQFAAIIGFGAAAVRAYIPIHDAVRRTQAAAKRLSAAGAAADSESVATPVRALGDAANEMKRSFSGSWLGYHSRVYYRGLAPAPSGTHFSQEWACDRAVIGRSSTQNR